VIALSIAGIAVSAVGPRILGHATDLLFNGVIGRRLPTGITKEQAVAAARARGNNTFADLLSGMNVVSGRGVDFGAVGRTLALALGLYLLAALLIWLQARILSVTVQRTMRALRADVGDKVHRLPLSYFDGRQRGELLSRVTNDIDNAQASLSMTIGRLVSAVLTLVTVLAMMVSISTLLGRDQLLRRTTATIGHRACGDPAPGHLPVRRRDGPRVATGDLRGFYGNHCRTTDLDRPAVRRGGRHRRRASRGLGCPRIVAARLPDIRRVRRFPIVGRRAGAQP
jgi:ABC-type multidrug transport system fused ATPase/permease subunit